MRRLLFKLLAIALPPALLVILSNYFIDPANLFSSSSYVSGIAAILSEGNNVDNISNYDERILQQEMIFRLKDTPDIIVLGSSRIMEIGSDFFPHKKVLNLGVSHANIHDLIALTGILDSTGHLPGEMYMNVDAGLISKAGTSEWQRLALYYNRFIRNYGGLNLHDENNFSHFMSGLYPLISFEYFRESMEFLFKGKNKKYVDVGEKRPPRNGRFSDGTICYPYQYMHPDLMRMADIAGRTATNEGLSEPDTTNLRLLNTLLDFFRQKKVKLHFIMLPYHPAYYNAINNHQRGLFLKYDSIFRNLARERGIDVKGGFDAAALGINSNEFYDMYHCSKEAIMKIIHN